MGQPAEQQRVTKRELRRARDLLVGEFRCEICLDNGDVESKTSELVPLNVIYLINSVTIYCSTYARILSVRN